MTEHPGTRISLRGLAALERIEHLATRELGTQQVVEDLVAEIAAVIDVDCFFAGATDPDTGLCLGAGMVFNYHHEVCQPFWEHEFLVPDYNKFADLDPADPVADLREATGGRPTRSARYRTLYGISDLQEELRAIFCAGGRTWGNLQLNRRSGGAPFSAADRAFLRAAAPLAGVALRRSLLEEPAHTDPSRGPGVVLLDADGTMLSCTDEAHAWLQELASAWRVPAVPGLSDILIHPELLTLSLSTLDDTSGPRRARLRTRSGTWLIAQASVLRTTGHVALVIEPAKASEIAPIVVEAYALTAREVEVTRLVARGLSTEEIAAALLLSRHTIRDHLKAIFEKVGVSSRGELTSRLFAEHYHPALDQAIGGAMARTEVRMHGLAAAP